MTSTRGSRRSCSTSGHRRATTRRSSANPTQRTHGSGVGAIALRVRAWIITETSGVAVNVLVVDDQETFRAAERAVISRLPGFALVAEAASGEEAVELAEALAPDLVLMD